MARSQPLNEAYLLKEDRRQLWHRPSADVADGEAWQERSLLAAENAWRLQPRDEDALREEQVKQLQQKVGELALDIDIVKEAMRGRPFAERTSDQ